MFFSQEENWWKKIPYKIILLFGIALLLFSEFIPIFFNLHIGPLHKTLINICLTDPFVSSAFLVVFLFFPFIFSKDRNLIVANLALACAFEMALFSCANGYNRSNLGLGLGLATVFLLLGLVFSNKNVEREKVLAYLSISTALPIVQITQLHIGSFFAGENIPLDGQVFDLVAYYVDNLTGLPLCFYISKCTVNANDVIVFTFSAVYAWLPVIMGTAAIFVYCNPLKTKYHPLFTYVLIGALGFLCYRYFPIVGSLALLGHNWPLGEPPHIDDIEQIIKAPQTFQRNGMPSLHMAWALSAYWLLDGVKDKIRYFFALWAILTAWSTFYFGQHYFVDLVIAIPFTLLCFSLSCKNCILSILKIRLLCFTFGFVSVYGSLTIFRFYPNLLLENPHLVWPALSMLVIISFGLKYLLDRKLSEVSDLENY